MFGFVNDHRIKLTFVSATGLILLCKCHRQEEFSGAGEPEINKACCVSGLYCVEGVEQKLSSVLCGNLRFSSYPTDVCCQRKANVSYFVTIETENCR